MSNRPIMAIDLDGVLGPHISSLFTSIKPYDGAVETIAHLKTKYELHIVTARHLFVRKQTRSWLNKYFPNTFSGVHFVHYYTPLGPRSLKSVICKRIGAKIILDDKYSNAIDCAKNGITVFLYGSYHAAIKNHLPKGVTWTKDWKAVIDEVM
jgi:5'(3')-deoxyribonucleotidase